MFQRTERTLGRLGVVVATAPAVVGSGGSVYRLQSGVARPVVESDMVGDGERRRNKVVKFGAPGALTKTTRLVRILYI
jgi:hypothetical protein